MFKALFLATVGLGAGLLVPVALVSQSEGRPEKPALPRDPSKYVGPPLPEEDAAERYLAAVLVRPESLRILEWGPHDLAAGLKADFKLGAVYPYDLGHPLRAATTKEAQDAICYTDAGRERLSRLGKPPWPLVRVRFRADGPRGQECTVDLLLAVRGGGVAHFGPTPSVPAWRWRDSFRVQTLDAERFGN